MNAIAKLLFPHLEKSGGDLRMHPHPKLGTIQLYFYPASDKEYFELIETDIQNREEFVNAYGVAIKQLEKKMNGRQLMETWKNAKIKDAEA